MFDILLTFTSQNKNNKMSETTNQSPPTSAVQAAYPDFVRRLYNRTGDLSKDFAHAILGIVTEIHEFRTATDDVNALEELGDLFFYTEALEQVLDEFDQEFSATLAVDHLVRPAAIALVDRVRGSTSGHIIDQEVKKLLDHAKRWVGYGKAPAAPITVFVDVCVLVSLVEHLAPTQFALDRVLEANMKKLLKRYPTGEFDAFRAVVRDLEAERAVLQAA